MAAKKREVLSDGAQKALKRFEETVAFHNNFVMVARDRYRSYKGLMEKDSDPDSWESKLHPPYIKHIVETQVAALMEDKLLFRIRPKPKFYSPEEQAMAEEGARAHEILFRYQLQQDRFHEKQRQLVLQNLITGISIAKTFWRSDTRRRKKLEAVDLGAEYGYPPGLLVDLRESEYADRMYDGPCTEVVNVEDFFWHEAAVELQRSPIIGHRVPMTFEELKQAEASGQYENVDELKDTRSVFGKESVSLYDLDDRERTRDMIEVLELWWLEEDGIKTCTIGNRKVELKKPRANPFWHGEYPFVAAITSPDLFKVQGNSLVGNIAHLQDAAHDFLNQSVDNMRLINNFITAVDTTRADPDALEVAPGERWELEGPINEIVQQFQPATTTAEIALPYITMLENNMQNLAGGHPFTTTSEAGRQGSDTATEAALVSSLAQSSAKQMKLQLNYAYERIGYQRMCLNAQFIRRPIMVEQIGLDQQAEFVQIAPWLLQEQSFDLEPMGESLMRQERRAEANALAQAAAQLYPLLLQSKTPLNLGAIAEFLFKQYVDDPKQFFSTPQPPQMAPPMPGMPQQQAPQQMNGGGMTAPEATNPVNSPSNAASISPEVMMQRALAQQGGANNVPSY